MVQLAKDEELINQSIVFNFIQKVFKQQLTDQAKQELWQEVYGVFNKGIGQSLSQETDAVLRNHLNHNVATFAAFKNHSFQTELVKILVNENGDLRSWDEFKTLANTISANYNQRWLRAEYDLSVHSANQAAKWQDFEERKDLYPNLRYEAIDDGRTRLQHKAWDGLILPIDHAFWKTHYPPNDWGCRCDVVQTDDDTNTKDEKGLEVPVNNMPKLPKQFNMNVGQQKKIFDLKEHPYSAEFKGELPKELIKIVLGQMRKETSDFALKNLRKNYELPQIGQVQLSGKGIKEIINQPHNNPIGKLETLINLEEEIKKAKFIKQVDDFKNRTNIKAFYYFELENNMILVVREMEKDNYKQIYSIVDKK